MKLIVFLISLIRITVYLNKGGSSNITVNTVRTVRERAGFRGGAGKRGVGTRGGRQRPGQSAGSTQQYALDVTPCCVVQTRELSMRIVAEECIAVGSSVETALPPAMVRPHKTLPLVNVTRIVELSSSYIKLLPPLAPFYCLYTLCYKMQRLLIFNNLYKTNLAIPTLTSHD